MARNKPQRPCTGYLLPSSSLTLSLPLTLLSHQPPFCFLTISACTSGPLHVLLLLPRLYTTSVVAFRLTVQMPPPCQGGSPSPLHHLCHSGCVFRLYSCCLFTNLFVILLSVSCPWEAGIFPPGRQLCPNIENGCTQGHICVKWSSPAWSLTCLLRGLFTTADATAQFIASAAKAGRAVFPLWRLPSSCSVGGAKARRCLLPGKRGSEETDRGSSSASHSLTEVDVWDLGIIARWSARGRRP